MRNYWLLIIIFSLFLVACDNDEGIVLDNNMNINPSSDTTTIDTAKSVEEKFNITEPYFYTGLINGVRYTYQTNGRSGYIPIVSKGRSSSGGIGKRYVTTGFDNMLLDIYYEYGYFGIPDTSKIFYLNKNYTCSNGSNIANDTLRYNLRYTNNGVYYRSDCCSDLNQDAILKFTQFIPPQDRDFPLLDVEALYRCKIDSLFFRAGSDTLLFTDFIIQTKYK